MTTETRRRFANYGGPSQPDTHEDDFREAFKRQRRSVAAAAELQKLDEEITDEADVRARLRLIERRKYLLVLTAKGEENAAEDAEILLEADPVEVLDVETISGPRRITVDRVDQYEAVLGDPEGDEEPEEAPE